MAASANSTLMRKILIAYRRQAFIESITCTECNGPIMRLPKEAEPDNFYLANREMWRRIARKNGAKRLCRFCDLARGRAKGQRRRALIAASPDHFTSKDLRAKYTAQEGRCVYCGTDLDGVAFHVDHIQPLSRGGSNGPGNIQITCPPCNLSKNARSHEEFLRYRLTKRKLECNNSGTM
jgi:5-methylcytosine-specific restriction endonuclease McrA